MRTRLIEALCVLLLAPLPLFLDFADAARWVRYLATGNEAPVRLPPGDSIVLFSPLSFGLIAVAFLAVWGLTLLLTRWLGSKDRLPTSYRFLLFWGLLGAVWIALQLIAGIPMGLMSIAWSAFKFGLGTLVAAVVAVLITTLTRPRGADGQS